MLFFNGMENGIRSLKILDKSFFGMQDLAFAVEGRVVFDVPRNFEAHTLCVDSIEKDVITSLQTLLNLEGLVKFFILVSYVRES